MSVSTVAVLIFKLLKHSFMTSLVLDMSYLIIFDA